MTAANPFLFDRSFEADLATPSAAVTPTGAATPPPGANELEPLAPAPLFTEEELGRAREEAMAAGRQAATAELTASAEARLAKALQAAADGIEALSTTRQEMADRATRDAVAVAGALIGKLFPSLAKRNGVEEIARLIESVLADRIAAPSVTVHVAPELRDAVTERLTALPHWHAATANGNVVGDPAVAVGDCRIAWPGGGAERNVEALWHELETLIEGALTAPPAPASGDDAPASPAIATEPSSDPTGGTEP